jgi:predicted DNA-binding transcriptional regulator
MVWVGAPGRPFRTHFSAFISPLPARNPSPLLSYLRRWHKHGRKVANMTDTLASRDRVLNAIGIADAEESVYRLLLERSGLKAAELARSLGIQPQRVRDALDQLERAGLVSRVAGRPVRYTAAPPDIALGILILRRQEELERTRLAVSEMADTFRANRPLATQAAETIEVVMGRAAIVQRFEQLQRSATHEIRVFDQPPYAITPGVNDLLELELLQSGIRCRAIYEGSGLTDEKIKGISQIVAAGEQARVAESLPLKLAIADVGLALVPITLDDPGLESAVLIYRSPLLDALARLFELMWTNAIPLPLLADPEGTPDDPADGEERENQQIVGLLLAGLKDEAIARQSGVTLRTAQRRVRRLMDSLQATTRFQAGWLAARRGWPPED